MTAQNVEGEVDPAPYSSPFDLLPPDMWYDDVFPRVGADEKVALYNSCTAFKNLLEPSKSLWIFPAILSRVSKYLGVDDTLKLLLVCRNWSAAVNECTLEKIYEKEFRFFDQDLMTFHVEPLRNPTGHIPLANGITIGSIAEIQSLMERMGNVENAQRSVPGGKLVVNPYLIINGKGILLNLDQFYLALLTLLEIVGPSIRYLVMALPSILDTDPQRAPLNGWFIRHLLTFLARVPNLRFLHLQAMPGLSTPLDYENLPGLRAVEPLPFPGPLKFLRHFGTSFSEQSPELCNELIDLVHPFIPEHIPWKVQVYRSGNFPEVECFDRMQDMLLQVSIEKIRDIPVATNVTTLIYRTNGSGRGGGEGDGNGEIDAVGILRALQNRFPSLRTLMIESTTGTSGFSFPHSPPIPEDLIFPSVTTLKLVVIGDCGCNLLWSFPALRSLQVENTKTILGGPGTPVEATESEAAWWNFDHMEESPGWERLPKLEKVSILSRVIWLGELEQIQYGQLQVFQGELKFEFNRPQS